MIRPLAIAALLLCPALTITAVATMPRPAPYTRIIRYIETPDACDEIITDGQPQHVCTSVTHIR